MGNCLSGSKPNGIVGQKDVASGTFARPAEPNEGLDQSGDLDAVTASVMDDLRNSCGLVDDKLQEYLTNGREIEARVLDALSLRAAAEMWSGRDRDPILSEDSMEIAGSLAWWLDFKAKVSRDLTTITITACNGPATNLSWKADPWLKEQVETGEISSEHAALFETNVVAHALALCESKGARDAEIHAYPGLVSLETRTTKLLTGDYVELTSSSGWSTYAVCSRSSARFSLEGAPSADEKATIRLINSYLALFGACKASTISAMSVALLPSAANLFRALGTIAQLKRAGIFGAGGTPELYLMVMTAGEGGTGNVAKIPITEDTLGLDLGGLGPAVVIAHNIVRTRLYGTAASVASMFGLAEISIVTPQMRMNDMERLASGNVAPAIRALGSWQSNYVDMLDWAVTKEGLSSTEEHVTGQHYNSYTTACSPLQEDVTVRGLRVSRKQGWRITGETARSRLKGKIKGKSFCVEVIGGEFVELSRNTFTLESFNFTVLGSGLGAGFRSRSGSQDAALLVDCLIAGEAGLDAARWAMAWVRSGRVKVSEAPCYWHGTSYTDGIVLNELLSPKLVNTLPALVDTENNAIYLVLPGGSGLAKVTDISSEKIHLVSAKTQDLNLSDFRSGTIASPRWAGMRQVD